MKLAWLTERGPFGWMWCNEETDGTQHFFRTNKQGEGVEKWNGGAPVVTKDNWTVLAHPGEYRMPRSRSGARNRIKTAIKRGQHW